MNELFIVYQYAFILCVVMAFPLSAAGAFIVARKEGLQVLALAQAALAGGLLARIIFAEQNESFKVVLFSWLFLLLTKVFFLKVDGIYKLRESFFVSIYVFLTSFCFLLISILPMLESHMAMGFFGDIISLDDTRSLIYSGGFAFFTLMIFVQRKSLILAAFEKTVLGMNKKCWMREIILTGIIIFSLSGLGILFTMAAMIIPAVFIGERGKSLKQNVILMGISVVLSSCLGMAISIWHERLSTVSIQIFFLLVFSLLIGLCFRSNNHGKSAG
ncbi:MAG: metal ABC transporter permease [Halobacteriovoraceae bacterium]|nr:metal ABC transporter permease [Halobacteriovoraceae bacterium]